MSRDREIIMREARRHAELSAFLEANGPCESEGTYRKFETVALWMNGDENRKFGALRVLMRHFGWAGTRMLIDMASPSDDTVWHLQLTPRADVNRPDGGKRRRKEAKKFETKRIGLAYYKYRDQGLTADAAIEKLNLDLRLNLTHRTISERLRAFRKGAEKRGFVDPYAAVLMTSASIQSIPEPRWTVEQICKPGRPRKTVQVAQEGSGGFPPLPKR